MATNSALDSATNGFAERGRTLKATHVIDVAAMAHLTGFQSLSGGPDGATHLGVTHRDVTHLDVTHLDVIVASGPNGPEVLIQPRAGQHALPGELYAQLPGAFGAPAAFDRTGGQGLAWSSPSANLQEYLQTHQFGAPALPGGQRNGHEDIDLEWTMQLSALGASQSIVVCQLSGSEPAVVEAALTAIDRLAQVTSQSQASGPQRGLHPFRFGFVVDLALTGQLDAPPAPAPVAPPVPTPVARPAPAPVAPASALPASVVLPAPTARDAEVLRTDTFVLPDAELDAEALYDMSTTSWEASAGDDGAVDIRARVAEALGRYEGKRVSIGVIADQKKLNNVLRGVAPDIEADDMCGFVDTGARANGKSGAVFTTTTVHFTGLSGRQHYDYTAIGSFELEASAVILNGVDGSRAKISTSGQSLAIAEAVAAATGLSV